MARKKLRNLGYVVDLLKQIPADVFEDITIPDFQKRGRVSWRCSLWRKRHATPSYAGSRRKKPRRCSN
jgi:hypothetical protein